MAQQTKALPLQTLQPEFNPWKPRGGKREQTPTRYPPTTAMFEEGGTGNLQNMETQTLRSQAKIKCVTNKL